MYFLNKNLIFTSQFTIEKLFVVFKAINSHKITDFGVITKSKKT